MLSRFSTPQRFRCANLTGTQLFTHALEILFDVPCTFLSTFAPCAPYPIKLHPAFSTNLISRLSRSTFPHPSHSFLSFNIVFSRIRFTEWRKGCLTSGILFAFSFHWHDKIYCVGTYSELYDSDSIRAFHIVYLIFVYLLDNAYSLDIRKWEH